MTIEIDNEILDDERVRDLILKLQVEIKELHQENDSLRNDIQSLVEYIYELKLILGDSVYKIQNQNAKYMLEKYMLDQYHESKTKPIKKKGIHPSLKR
jgi:hypothetical protein